MPDAGDHETESDAGTETASEEGTGTASDAGTETEPASEPDAETGTEPARDPDTGADSSGGSDMVYCTNCGEEIYREAEICPECGVRQRDPGGSTATSSGSGGQAKDPGIAAVLSFFFTGLGQLYNGEIGKGIAFIVVQGINFVLIFFLIGLVTFPLVWIFGIYDAYKSAERINASQNAG